MRAFFISMVVALANFVGSGAYAASSCTQQLVSKGWQTWAFTITDTGVTGKLMVEFRPGGMANVKVLVDNNPGKSWAASNERWGVGDGYAQVVFNTNQNPDPNQPYRTTLQLNRSCEVFQVSQEGGGLNVLFR